MSDEADLVRLMHEPVLRIELARSGATDRSFRLETASGRWFAKVGHGVGPRFRGEVAGLEHLARANSGLVIPRVRALTSPNRGFAAIVLEHLDEAPRPRDFEAILGAGLAAIHRQTADAFGFVTTTHCGPTEQDNRPRSRWIEFYREQRLGPLLASLEMQGSLQSGHRRVFDALLGRLDDRLAGPDEPPALIHGDLWAGNVLSTSRGVAIFDPAAYHGHREAELGMTTLFGGFSPRFYAAYEEAWPLAAGWRERTPLYQLHHLLNHARLFGGGYLDEALAIARRYA